MFNYCCPRWIFTVDILPFWSYFGPTPDTILYETQSKILHYSLYTDIFACPYLTCCGKTSCLIISHEFIRAFCFDSYVGPYMLALTNNSFFQGRIINKWENELFRFLWIAKLYWWIMKVLLKLAFDVSSSVAFPHSECYDNMDVNEIVVQD